MPEPGYYVDKPPYLDPEDLRYVTVRLRAGTLRRLRSAHVPEGRRGNDEAWTRALLDNYARLLEDEARWRAGKPPLVKAADAAESALRRFGRGVASLRETDPPDEGEEGGRDRTA